jgi:signal transduction histidine kinase
MVKYFDLIGKSVVKMDRLLIDLVSITNLAQGELQVGWIDFNKITQDIMLSLGHYPNFGTIRINNNMTTPFPFYGDESLLNSVMQNLIDNAVKYRKVDDHIQSFISIDITCDEKQVLIRIIDNGIGIAEKSLGKVFDMFYRGVSISHGTGLGLYIVKTAVEKMKGTISLQSIEGEGTSVYITLPNLK